MEKSGSIKFDTVIWFIAGLLIPLWPISLPLCWYMSYRSYKRGGAAGSMDELRSAHDLLQKGVLSDSEFQKIKSDALGTTKR